MRGAAVLLMMLALAMPASAGGNGAVREACKADIATLCADVQPGGGRIKACMKSNKDKLSDGCRSAIAAAMQARRAAKASSAPANAASPAPAQQ